MCFIIHLSILIRQGSLQAPANEAIAWGRGCQRGLDVLGHTRCCPKAQGSLGGFRESLHSTPHLAPGICCANCCFYRGRQQQSPQLLLEEGLSWIRTIQEISPDSSNVSAVLSSVVPLGFLLNFSVLPLRSKHWLLLHLSAQQLPAFRGGSCRTPLCWAELEN